LAVASLKAESENPSFKTASQYLASPILLSQ
jgi:hypothetical protein